MKRALIIVVLAGMFLAGCGQLRFAPGQKQKQNAWVHSRTTAAAADAARAEQTSQTLQELTELSHLQSSAFVGYFGMPDEPAAIAGVEDILAEHNYELAQTAQQQSLQRPDPWAAADGILELAIGVSALAGGVYGHKAVRFFKHARRKSQALKEIIDGNELFKKQNTASAAAFKQAQAHQCPETKKLVTEMKG